VVVCGFHTANWKCLTSWDNSTTPHSAKITDAVRLCYRANSELHALAEHILQRASLKDQYSQYYYLSMMGGVFLIADVTRRIASDPKDLVYGLYSMLTDMGYNIEEPDYDKSIAEIYEDFSFGVIERTRSLYTLWAFPNSISLPYLPSWVLNLQKRSTQPNARDLSIASYDENRLTYFREDFKLQRRQRSQLFLEGLISGSLEMLGTEIPDLHLEKLVGDPEGSIRMTMVNWLSKTLELSDHITKCPNGQSGSRALLDTLCTMADGSSPPQFAVESVKSKVQSVLGYRAISCDPDMRKRFATACNRPSLGQLSSQDMFDHLCKSYDPQVPPLMSLLFDLFWKSKGTTPVLLSNGCIGLGYGKMQVGDKVVLLYGSMSPMIVRPSGSHYQLIGPADIGGIAKQQWPLREDQEGIEMITLV